MRKFYIFVFVIFCSNIFAQEIKVGAKGGLNLSSVRGDFTDRLSSRVSFHLGGFVEIPLNNKIYLQPELLYSSQGYKDRAEIQNFDSSIVSSSFEFVSRSNYLNIPVDLKFYLGEKFMVEVGPQIGFLINTVSKVTKGNVEGNDENSYSGKFKLDYGANLGLGFQLNDKLSLQLRYYLGLSNLLKDTLVGSQYNQFQSVLQLSVAHVIF